MRKTGHTLESCPAYTAVLQLEGRDPSIWGRASPSKKPFGPGETIYVSHGQDPVCKNLKSGEGCSPHPGQGIPWLYQGKGLHEEVHSTVGGGAGLTCFGRLCRSVTSPHDRRFSASLALGLDSSSLQDSHHGGPTRRRQGAAEIVPEEDCPLRKSGVPPHHPL